MHGAIERCTKDDGIIDWDRAFSNEEVEQDDIIAAERKISYAYALVLASMQLEGKSDLRKGDYLVGGEISHVNHQDLEAYNYEFTSLET